MLADATLRDIPDEERSMWRETARKSATFCADAYANSPIGLAPESWNNKYGSSGWQDRWMLRPEVIESIYYMYHFTGDEQWRDRSWKIAQSVNEHARQKFGFGTITSIHKNPIVENEQQSFFLAETLKYLYLTHTTRQEFDPTRFVLTTEAHPLRRFCDIPSNVSVSSQTRPSEGQGASVFLEGPTNLLVSLGIVDPDIPEAGHLNPYRSANTSMVGKCAPPTVDHLVVWQIFSTQDGLEQINKNNLHFLPEGSEVRFIEHHHGMLKYARELSEILDRCANIQGFYDAFVLLRPVEDNE